MNELTPLVVITILVTVTLMLLSVRRLRAGVAHGLRPLAVPERLRTQVARAVERGGLLHITLGRASLAGLASPTSVVALQLLDRLAQEGCENNVAPMVTTGDGTLFVAGQDSLRGAYEQTGRAAEASFSAARFMAPNDFPFTYVAGVSTILHESSVADTVALGRFGAELAIMAEAASREEIHQVIGTDDPVAMAIATATTESVLWGEELFAAPAYLEGSVSQLASVRTQDVLRWLLVGALLLVALLQLLDLL